MNEIEKRLIRKYREMEMQKKPKIWKPNWRMRGLFKKSKKPEFILVLYLTQKYDAFFSLQRIISGNIIVFKNKVHVLNPKKIFSFGKNKFYIIREIDRQPISNEDYEEVRNAGRSTDEDVPLIKAVLGAVQKEQKIMPGKSIITWIIILAIILGVLYFFFGRG